MKKIIIDGRLGKDSEVKVTSKGTKYLRFAVANDVYTNGETKTEWYDVMTFDTFAIEKKSEYLKKGRYVIVTGTPTSSVNTSNGKIYLNHSILAESIELPSLGGGKKEDNTVVEGVSTFSPNQQARPSVAAQPSVAQGYQTAQPVQRQQTVQQPYVHQQGNAQYGNQQPSYQSQVQQAQPSYQPQPQPQAYQPGPQAFTDTIDDEELPF